MSLWTAIFGPPPVRHVWKEERRETLGSFIDFGNDPSDINTVYRIAIFEKCLLTGDTRIREINDLFPAGTR